ncbi:hypothetical protein INT43_006000 [Umbelopsis isabellina]|uniref:F-box domain-containing protein n=1 Tax=Mortierella isabellina TaxID=91625 RepID=A0A8H7UCK5_MORIS|nr:hypothetical protein INT43_006000 [Umbelopsis isabellina]
MCYQEALLYFQAVKLQSFITFTMSYNSIGGAPQLPTEIIILILTYMPTAKAFSNSRLLSKLYNTLCLSHSVQRQWLLHLPFSPDVITYANKLRIGLPFTHARLAMEAGVSRHNIHNISVMSEIYLEKALPSFLYNISVLSDPSKDNTEFLDGTYKQHFIFRPADKHSDLYRSNWIAQTFGQSEDTGGLVRIWAVQAFDVTISEYYQAIAKSISLNPSYQHLNALTV